MENENADQMETDLEKFIRIMDALPPPPGWELVQKGSIVVVSGKNTKKEEGK